MTLLSTGSMIRAILIPGRKWAEYIEAYNELLSRCNPDVAPWYIIPSDHKWYRNWAMGRILLETMRSMKLTWPPANFDVEAEKRRLEQA